MKKFTVALCTYNRAGNLPRLVESLRSQVCSIPFEILFVDNNSSDNTQAVLAELAAQPGVPLRFVRETQQGIPYARNRALAECMDSDYMLFMDDDELPSSPQMVEVAARALMRGDAQCVGGKVRIDFSRGQRPDWLTDELLPFYAEIDHGDEPFVIQDASTPIWTSIIAYDMQLFRDDENLRFDVRYNRGANGIGGGEDHVMFQAMLAKGVAMMYLPEMGVNHYVEPWRMTRRYFWKLHFFAGRKRGQFDTPDYARSVLGVPPFLLAQVMRQLAKAVGMWLRGDAHYVRQGMNASHALGMVHGRYRGWKSAC